MPWSTSCVYRFMYLHETISKRSSPTNNYLRREIASTRAQGSSSLKAHRLSLGTEVLLSNGPGGTVLHNRASCWKESQSWLWRTVKAQSHPGQSGKRVGAQSLQKLVRTWIPQLKRYCAERKEQWGKWRTSKEISKFRSIVSTEVFHFVYTLVNENRNEFSLPSTRWKLRHPEVSQEVT